MSTKSDSANGIAIARKRRPADGVDGLFHPGDLLTAAELRRRIGWGSDAFRKARKQGLRVLKIGNTRFVRAADLIEFVEQKGIEEETAGTDASGET